MAKDGKNKELNITTKVILPILAIIDESEPSYKRDGMHSMDKNGKDFAFYEWNGDILAVERHYAEHGSVSECIRDILRMNRKIEIAQLEKSTYTEGDTAAATSTEEGSK